MSDEKKFGVEQILKVLDVVIEAGNVSEKVAEADTVVGKVMALMPLSDDLLRLMSLSPIGLKAEWNDLDDEEREQLRSHFSEKFDIQNDLMEGRIENGLVLVQDAVSMIDRMVDYSRSFRKEA